MNACIFSFVGRSQFPIERLARKRDYRKNIRGVDLDPLIITAAITGSRITRQTAPYIPITPEEVVQSALECWSAGASVAHIHVRDPKTGAGSQDREHGAESREREQQVSEK